MNWQEELELKDLPYLRRVIEDDEGNGGPFDRYVTAIRLVLEKCDRIEADANETADLGPLFKIICDEFRQVVVNSVLFGRDELPGHKKDVTS